MVIFFFLDNSTCNDELLTNKEKNYSEPENELDQNQHNSSESDDSISESKYARFLNRVFCNIQQ